MPLLDFGENESQEYMFLIEDLATTEQGQNVEIDFQQNFTVSGETIPYTINKGFIVTSDNFEIEITLNRDLDEEILVDFPEERAVLLKPGQNKIFFDVENSDGGFYEISVGDYLIPLDLLKNPGRQVPDLKFDPFEIDSVILIDSDGIYTFKIIHTGLENIEDFYFEYNQDFFDITGIPDIIEAGEIYEFGLNLKIPNEPIDETIYLTYGDESVFFPVNIIYTENEEEIIVPGEKSEEVSYSCSVLKGVECGNQESCSGNVVSSLDVNECCLGQCSEEESGSLAWVGWLLGFILVIVLLFVGIKYFRTRKQKDVFRRKVREAGKTMPVFSLFF